MLNVFLVAVKIIKQEKELKNIRIFFTYSRPAAGQIEQV